MSLLFGLCQCLGIRDEHLSQASYAIGRECEERVSSLLRKHVERQHVCRLVYPTIVSIESLHRLRIGDNQAHLIKRRNSFISEDLANYLPNPASVHRRPKSVLNVDADLFFHNK